MDSVQSFRSLLSSFASFFFFQTHRCWLKLQRVPELHLSTLSDLTLGQQWCTFWLQTWSPGGSFPPKTEFLQLLPGFLTPHFPGGITSRMQYLEAGRTFECGRKAGISGFIDHLKLFLFDFLQTADSLHVVLDSTHRFGIGGPWSRWWWGGEAACIMKGTYLKVFWLVSLQGKSLCIRAQTSHLWQFLASDRPLNKGAAVNINAPDCSTSSSLVFLMGFRLF